MAWNLVGNIKGPAGAQGPQGIQGPAGEAGAAGPAGLEWKGAWSNVTAYDVNDSVSWGGSTYFVVDNARAAGAAPPTGTAADPGADDSALNAGWAMLAIQGSQGPQGAQGIQGPQGEAGAAGAAGATGTRGSQWYVGNGAPVAGNTVGSIPGDKYLDQVSGDVYDLT